MTSAQQTLLKSLTGGVNIDGRDFTTVDLAPFVQSDEAFQLVDKAFLDYWSQHITEHIAGRVTYVTGDVLTTRLPPAWQAAFCIAGVCSVPRQDTERIRFAHCLLYVYKDTRRSVFNQLTLNPRYYYQKLTETFHEVQDKEVTDALGALRSLAEIPLQNASEWMNAHYGDWDNYCTILAKKYNMRSRDFPAFEVRYTM